MNKIVISRLDALVVPSNIDTKTSLKSLHRFVDARSKTRNAGGVVFMEVVDTFPIRFVILSEDLVPNVQSGLTSLFHCTVD